MKCADARRDMFAFLDGALTVERNLEVLQHLNVCASCGKRFEAEKRFEEGVGRTLREEPAPAGLKNRLAAALDREDAGVPADLPVRRVPRPAHRRLRWLAAAAAALVAAVFVADRTCIGPFQCPVLLAAVEVAAGSDAGPARGELPGAPDLAAAGYRNVCHAEGVAAPALGLDGKALVYEGPGGKAWIVSLPTGDHEPKSWNRVVEDGLAWYEARVGEFRVCGWMEPGGFRAVVAKSEAVDLDRLARIARGK